MSSLRYLYGPVTGDFAEQNLRPARQAGRCLAFGTGSGLDAAIGAHDSWEELLRRLPEGWRPDFIALQMQYNSIPGWLWQAPVPIVGLAADWTIQWHGYRRAALPFCDLVLTDALGVEVMRKAGFPHVRQANLFGLPLRTTSESHADADQPAAPRDIDVLYVGNVHPAVQRERLPYLGRLAALGERWKIVVRGGVFGEDYRRLLARSRIVFNRAIRSECNLRVFEAIAAGALLLQERGNRETPLYLREGEEYASYGDDDFESVVEHYLENEPARARIVEGARERVNEFGFARLWEERLERIEAEWPGLVARAAARTSALPALPDWPGRVWQGASAPGGLGADLQQALLAAVRERPRDAALLNALAAVTLACGQGRPDGIVQATSIVQDAWLADPRHAVAGLNLAEALAARGQGDHAIEQCERALAMLDDVPVQDVADVPHACGLDDPLLLPGFGDFRVEWERAAWQNAGDARAEAQAKTTLVRWRLHTLMGELSGDPLCHYAACLLRPDLPATRAALGAALAKHGRFADAVPHLAEALRADPFDAATAAALHNGFGRLGMAARQQELMRSRRMLNAAAPELVRSEAWFAAQPAASVSTPITPPLRVVWQGAQEAVHSLALVNRNLCAALVARGHELSLWRQSGCEPPGGHLALPAALAECRERTLSGPADVYVIHQWPPDFTGNLANLPAGTRRVVIQPWEFGSIPKAWVAPLRDCVDELWVPSAFVRNCFVRGGVPETKVHVVPLGVADVFFRDDATAFPLKTRKRFKFLFVGGTLPRKGFDLLLKAYRQVFSANDDVCLVVKDMGVGSFYQGQTAEKQIEELRRMPAAPEVEYLGDELSDEQMAWLYRACDCAVQPFRGEGFCLPVAEAMASGLPVIVSGYGPALDYCSNETAYLLPCRVVRFDDRRVGDLETVDLPFLAEPSHEALRHRLRHVFENPAEARRRGGRARDYARSHLTWAHAAAIAERRLAALRDGRGASAELIHVKDDRRAERSLMMIVKNEEKNLPDCLTPLAGLFGQIVVTDTGSTDRTVEIARQFGAEVHHFPWIDDFAAARNVSLKHATGAWLFWMDADDRLDAENREKLRRLVAELPADNVAFVLQCVCLPANPDDDSTRVDHIRLFRKLPGLAWEHRIHEQILPSLRRAGAVPTRCGVKVHHVGYQDAGVRAGKLERDLRILHREHAELGEHPFTLFNLGNTYIDLGNTEQALDFYRRSLAGSALEDSIVSKLYTQIARCERLVGRPADGLATCRQGLAHFADDAEILFQASLIQHQLGDLAGAIASVQRLIGGSEREYFASVSTGLRGYIARTNLAVYYREAGRLDDAETECRRALADHPRFVPALFALGDVLLDRRAWPALEELVARLRSNPATTVEADVFQARAHLARQEFAAARAALTATIARHPQALSARITMAQVLLQEDLDLRAAEQALRAVLEIAPNHAETQRHLDVLLLRRQAG